MVFDPKQSMHHLNIALVITQTYIARLVAQQRNVDAHNQARDAVKDKSYTHTSKENCIS